MSINLRWKADCCTEISHKIRDYFKTNCQLFGFDAAYDTSFEDYMRDKGIYTEDIEEASGTKWTYCGDQLAEVKGFHRLQFFMDDWG